jgi:hypothetical protein
MPRRFAQRRLLVVPVGVPVAVAGSIDWSGAGLRSRLGCGRWSWRRRRLGRSLSGWLLLRRGGLLSPFAGRARSHRRRVGGRRRCRRGRLRSRDRRGRRLGSRRLPRGRSGARARRRGGLVSSGGLVASRIRSRRLRRGLRRHREAGADRVARAGVGVRLSSAKGARGARATIGRARGQGNRVVEVARLRLVGGDRTDREVRPFLVGRERDQAQRHRGSQPEHGERRAAHPFHQAAPGEAGPGRQSRQQLSSPGEHLVRHRRGLPEPIALRAGTPSFDWVIR